VGLYRGEDNRPVQYYVRLPEIEGRTFVVCDPMLATGYSGAHAVQVLIDRGVKPENIRFLALVAAPEGVEVFTKQHPTIQVYVAALDSHLNEKAYIVPGLGDAGDRIFGTKH
jgi:uracil phosphoribosyltransferase